MKETMISASRPVSVLKMEREDTGLTVSGNGKNAGDPIFDYFVTYGILPGNKMLVLTFRSKKFASATINCLNHLTDRQLVDYEPDTE